MYFSFGLDSVGAFFLVLFTFMWIVVGIYALRYMTYQTNKRRFFVCYILTYIMLACLCLAQNYFTMIFSYGFMTLLSVPLVLHDETEQAVEAAKKYIFYSVAGITLGIAGMFFAGPNCSSYLFVAGGSLKAEALESGSNILRTAIFISILGYGAKAGLFPLHASLPAAHPVAPCPASAVLSGAVSNAGVLCIIRVIYFVFGPAIIEGSWVQYTLSALALLTVVTGTLMAYQQTRLKSRLAYSTVSQMSCILFGIFTLNPIGMLGAFLHIVYHCIIKNCLFMVAGGIKFANHFREGEEVSETQIARSRAEIPSIEGLGKQMPVSFACFTVASLGLIGIAPMAGFLSKWYIGTGSLDEGLVVISWLGPACLMAMAMLTAACLLSISIKAFFPLKETEVTCHEIPPQMMFPVILLAVLVVLLGVFAQPLVDVVNGVIAGFM